MVPPSTEPRGVAARAETLENWFVVDDKSDRTQNIPRPSPLEAAKFEQNRDQTCAVPTGKRERTSASKATPASPAGWLEKSSPRETHGILAHAALMAAHRCALE